jgi:UDP-N-acetylmuramate: L-alanyl-gamma-D-glutamyl-meso-diaminopimelate ligase
MQKKSKLNVHLIGIAGKGMAGLALMLKQKGHNITGSDDGVYEPVLGMLKQNKIKFTEGHNPKNIPKNTDLIIIGKHAKLVPESNEEVKYAFDSGIKIQSLPEALGELAKNTENTVVAGSFGKSSVTALLSWCLIIGKKDPSYFIGAVPLGFKRNAHLGKGKNFIFEGDEYPSSNWDSRSKFLHLKPKNLILISGEHDHINIFKTEEDYLKPYQALIKLLPSTGLVVASLQGKNIQKIIGTSKNKIVYYSFDDKNSWHAENITYGKVTKFDLYNGKKKVTSLSTLLLGKHNIENIIGVSAFVLEKKMITSKDLVKAIKTFKGISGRLDLKTKKSEVAIYESYGSSYAKAKADFEAIAKHFPNKKLITIFEPHTFSWRNKNAKDWYQDIFDSSEEVLILPPPTHGINSDQMTHDEIVREASKNHKKIYSIKTEKEALEKLKKITKKDNIILLVTSGSLFGLTSSVPSLMEKMFPKK